MTKYFLYLAVILVFISCKKNDKSEPFQLENDYLSVAGLVSFLPVEYQQGGTKIVYKNIEGIELILNITSSFSTSTQTIREQIYTAQQFNVNFIVPDSFKFSLLLFNTGRYLGDGTASKKMNISLSAQETSNLNSILASIDFRDDLAYPDSNVTFHESKSYLDKVFNQVYSTEKYQISSAFSVVLENS